MKKHYQLMIMLIMLLSTIASAQSKKVLIKSRLAPNTNYVTQVDNLTNITMDIDASDDVKKSLASAGMSMPMAMKTEQRMEMNTLVSEADAQGNRKVEVQFTKNEVASSVGDKKLDMPPFGLAKIFYTVNKDEQAQIDSMAGDKLTNEVIESMKNMVMKAYVKFPDYPIGLGDKFEDKMPMNIPVKGFDAAVVLVSRFKVVAVTDTEVKLDVKQTMEMSMTSQEKKADVKMEGDGKGVAVYNIAMDHLTNYDVKLDMDMVFKMEGMNLTMKGDIISKAVSAKK
ncbi:hypothetical protein [Pseudochryseolinea flava]|uniref:Uncharacterized protein n=1 Tax=Pseudochryseolinea flava TaxID=2059302 RepID=A0A364Y2G0_9BACT|nr:hypothetical protein [Pseudochryseolinea flava]RAW01055.1 hypothetical protein DQQ10_12555 [Pseudochryseolinea flava]